MGCFSLLPPRVYLACIERERNERAPRETHHHQQRDINIILYIYLYRGGAIIGGIWGIGAKGGKKGYYGV
jgi:hypothetical protein